jgi:hypothetical protein
MGGIKRIKMAELKFKKPMLLSNNEYQLEELDYSNMYISIKRDGVRAEVTSKGIKGRSLKKFRNPKLDEYFREFFQHLGPFRILEAEIYCDGIPCREMAGICNSLDKDIPEGTKLYIFGMVELEKTFAERWNYINRCYQSTDIIEIVEQHKVGSPEEAQTTYQMMLDDGFEGAVLMDGSKLYKQGHVTIKQHIGFKMKPHKEEDLEIIGVTERLLNTNESQKNELGQSYKRNTVDSKESTGIAATFTCKVNNSEETTNVTITGTEESRRDVWSNKADYIGKYAVVKSMDYGAKDKPRHGRLVGIKEKCEK